ncbi:phage integrase SAM-like domain-containing protein [Mucilaginibacter flavidus]|uniref:phage integrase SAM-like domain-containing protein n=1 Tax=Mucilaginibacter flavidus TaxID=2949309 RepID=UPI002092E78E|nr:phage integrase SAM-like domain-containing protein [Mucilaginibacter flavidus]MCO5948092.1 site-specific integrase [Mucilaginibacter flavidus]
MATFNVLVLEHQEKKDGKFNVKVRITHKRVTVYNNTTYFVTKSQLKGNFEFKDRNIINTKNDLEKSYYQEANKMGEEINLYNARELADQLQARVSKAGDGTINFIAFGKTYIEKLIKLGRGSYAAKFTRAINNLVDFFGRDNVLTTEINHKNLDKLEEFLKTPRDYTRINQFGNEVTYHSDGAKNGIIDTMSCIRKLFNEAKNEFNDEEHDDIKIKNSPFNKYKVGKAIGDPEEKSVKPAHIKMIRDYKDIRPGSRMELGRDLFMLSFYLIGMNTADMFNVTEVKNGRIDYMRAKTTGRRKDKAFISIKIEPEAQELIDKYRDLTGKKIFRFHEMYSTSKVFNSMLNVGLLQLVANLKIAEDVRLYYARHSWATIARNVCRVSKDDVSLAMNHVDRAHAVTDIYIKKDWDILDEANLKVLQFFRESEENSTDFLALL